MKDLRAFIEHLESTGDLITINEELSVKFEVGAAIKLLAETDGRAVLFNNIKEYDTKIIGNLLGTRKRLAMAVGVEEHDLVATYLERRSKPIRPEVVDDGPVHEKIILENVDISKLLPILTHHEKDIGPYITTGVIIAKDPNTGSRGVGIHRILVKGGNKLGIFLNSPPLSQFLENAEKNDQPLEIAISIGVDPVTFFSAAISVTPGTDKIEVAGGLAGRPVPLVKCKTIELEAPANAEFVLEAVVLPNVREPEGPFGESTGYYLTYNNPVAEIRAVTHREYPLYHALMPFSGEEEVLIDFLWQVEKKEQFLASVKGLKDLHLYFFGLITVAQIEKNSENDAQRILKELMDKFAWGKTFIAVDTDVDIHNLKDVLWALSTRFQPARDIVLSENMPGLAIDPSANQRETTSGKGKVLITETSKIGMDATIPVKEHTKFEKIRVPHTILDRIKHMLFDLST